MEGRTCLVTGATSGIGLASAVGLAQRGATVLLAGPSLAEAEVAARAVVTRVATARVHPYGADFASMDQVRDLAARVLDEHAQLDVLVNNAGVYANRRTITRDGHELTLAVNFLAPFLLTSLLHPRLSERAGARIVNVSSVAHVAARFDFDDPHFERRRYHGFFAYAASKLALLCFTRELARRHPPPAPTSNALHPGVAGTSLVRTAGRVGRLLGWATPILRSPEKAARTSLYLACEPELATTSGAYFVDTRPVSPARKAREPELAQRLWSLAAELTNSAWDVSRATSTVIPRAP